MENKEEKQGKKALPPIWGKVLRIAGKVGAALLTLVLLLVIALYGVMYVLAKGPSPTASVLFVRSVRETSAVGFLANLFFTEEEILQITAENAEVEYEEIDTSLIDIPQKQEDQQLQGGEEGPVADSWGLVDEDGDGIILEEVRGEGYFGYMMVVKDPSRVIMGCAPASFEKRGYYVSQMVERFDGVAGINAGGFLDPNGTGDGSIPNTLVVFEGQIYYEENGVGNGFVGLDSNNILHVGRYSVEQIRSRDIQYGVCFGPVLVVNGEAVGRGGGVNPRTAIGQRSDGAILMLVIEGRQVTSLGATYDDLAEIMLSYGAVNACNLDGGSSTMMWYNGEYLNKCAAVSGERPIPTMFVVLKEDEGNE